MKLSIILPTCAVPIGSGRSYHFLPAAIKSALDGGHRDIEVLVGCDGDEPSVRAVCDSFGDERVRYVPFQLTRTWGNYQRNRLMAEHATGDYSVFIDHDDAFAPGALKNVADECETFPGRTFFFRTRLNCGVVVWIEKNLKSPRNMAGHGVVAPLKGGVLWGDSSDRLEDLYYIRRVHANCEDENKPVIWIPTVIALVRPWAPPEIVGWKSPLEDLATT